MTNFIIRDNSSRLDMLRLNGGHVRKIKRRYNLLQVVYMPQEQD